MAGTVGQPTPWWQLNEGGKTGQGALDNLTKSAPAGYQYDAVSMGYRPIVGSPTDMLAQRQRTQGMQDTRFAQGTQAFNTTEQALQGLLNNPYGGSASESFSAGAGGAGGTIPFFGAGSPYTPPGGSTFSYNAASPSFQPKVSEVNAPSIQPILDAAGASQNASFGKAKAQAGSLGQSAVGGLRASLAERGLVGSGTEARGLTDRLAAATNPLSDLNTEALRENTGVAQHGSDQALQAALANFQGGIAQRGQDIGVAEGAAGRGLQAAQTGYSGQIAQRGQDIQAGEANANRASQDNIAGYQGAITQRGQTLQAQEAQAQLAMQQKTLAQQAIASALSGLSRLY